MIILTGGAGFIGSNLLRRLNQDGLDDILIVDNLKNSDKYRNLVGTSFRDLVSKDEFYVRLARGDWDLTHLDAIMHQGACTDTMEYDGAYMMRTNYEASRELLIFALRRKVRLIYASSAAVYGHASEAIETPEWEAPLNIYGYSKLAFDNLVRRMGPGANSHVVGLRYFNVYGPGESHKGRMASMVYQLRNQILRNGVAKLFGAVGPYEAGCQTRDFVSVGDIVEMNVHFLNLQVSGSLTAVVNAGSGIRSTWNALAESVIEALGYGSIEYTPFPEELKDKYQFDTRADLSKLRELGYTKPMKGLGAGVREYFEQLHSFDTRFSPRL